MSVTELLNYRSVEVRESGSAGERKCGVMKYPSSYHRIQTQSPLLNWVENAALHQRRSVAPNRHNGVIPNRRSSIVLNSLQDLLVSVSDFHTPVILNLFQDLLHLPSDFHLSRFRIKSGMTHASTPLLTLQDQRFCL